ncbi:DUF4250 domain-containing protein [Shewanella sp. 125m-7]
MINEKLDTLSAEILVGIANEHLRLYCKDQQALFYDLDIESERLEQKLAASGFAYDARCNQYKPRS